MWKIAGNVYAAYLRKKSRSTNHSAYLDPNMPDDSSPVPDKIIDDDEKNLLHRELSFLSNQYREAMVLYYFENLSCSEIAVRQKISTEMVKYYLFRARKIVMEGMHMERIYGEKSYNPNYVKIDFWGTLGGQDNEYREFSKRKIKGNILAKTSSNLLKYSTNLFSSSLPIGFENLVLFIPIFLAVSFILLMNFS